MHVVCGEDGLVETGGRPDKGKRNLINKYFIFVSLEKFCMHVNCWRCVCCDNTIHTDINYIRFLFETKMSKKEKKRARNTKREEK